MQNKTFLNEIDLNNFINDHIFVYLKKFIIKKKFKKIFSVEYITFKDYELNVKKLIQSFFSKYNIDYLYKLNIAKDNISIMFEIQNDQQKKALTNKKIKNWKNILIFYLKNHTKYKNNVEITTTDSLDYQVNFPVYFEELKKILKQKNFKVYTTPYLNKKQRVKIHSISYKYKNITSKSQGKGKVKKIKITNKGYKDE